MKDCRPASATRAHPLRIEVVVRVACDLLWSRVFPTDAAALGEAKVARLAFVDRGWTPAE